MDIRVLRYFLTVAREESFSRAAQALYLSQPTLSRQIREMEEEVGVTLFIRTNRNVILTKEGMRLRKRAQEIVELMDKTSREFAELKEEIAGDVYIGTRGRWCAEWTTHQSRQRECRRAIQSAALSIGSSRVLPHSPSRLTIISLLPQNSRG